MCQEMLPASARRKNILIFLILYIVALRKTVDCYSSGAPESACRTLAPSHGRYQGLTIGCPYKIDAPQYYRPGEEITVKVRSRDILTALRGYLFAILKRDPVTNRASPVAGGIYRSGHKRVCQGFAVTHTNKEEKYSVEFKWRPPPRQPDNVYFVWLTAVQSYENFWVNQCGNFYIRPQLLTPTNIRLTQTNSIPSPSRAISHNSTRPRGTAPLSARTWLNTTISLTPSRPSSPRAQITTRPSTMARPHSVVSRRLITGLSHQAGTTTKPINATRSEVQTSTDTLIPQRVEETIASQAFSDVTGSIHEVGDSTTSTSSSSTETTVESATEKVTQVEQSTSVFFQTVELTNPTRSTSTMSKEDKEISYSTSTMTEADYGPQTTSSEPPPSDHSVPSTSLNNQSTMLWDETGVPSLPPFTQNSTSDPLEGLQENSQNILELEDTSQHFITNVTEPSRRNQDSTLNESFNDRPRNIISASSVEDHTNTLTNSSPSNIATEFDNDKNEVTTESVKTEIVSSKAPSFTISYCFITAIFVPWIQELHN